MQGHQKLLHDFPDDFDCDEVTFLNAVDEVHVSQTINSTPLLLLPLFRLVNR